MPYLPTPEKLQALGFDGPHERLLFDAYMQERPDHNGRMILVLKDGHVKLKEDDGQRWMFVLPSEAFFDQLLTAVGWTE